MPEYIYPLQHFLYYYVYMDRRAENNIPYPFPLHG